MPTFNVVQRLVALTPQYEIREGDTLSYVATGKVMTTTPKLALFGPEGESGKVLATMEGNFLQTTFNCFDPAGKTLCTLVFPALSLTKRFRLEVGEKVYSANGGVMGNVFSCKDAAGNSAFSVKRKQSFRDAFDLEVADDLDPHAGLLCSIAIYQHFNF